MAYKQSPYNTTLFEGHSKPLIVRSKEVDPARANFIAALRRKRPRSDWREVLGRQPEGGTRQEVR
jgi:hypothetical protein